MFASASSLFSLTAYSNAISKLSIDFNPPKSTFHQEPSFSVFPSATQSELLFPSLALVAGLFSLEPFAVFPNDKLLNWFPYIQISATAGQAFSIGSVNFNLIYLYVPSSIFVNCSPFEPALTSLVLWSQIVVYSVPSTEPSTLYFHAELFASPAKKIPNAFTFVIFFNSTT